MFKKILIGLLIIFAGIQLITIDRNNPEFDSSKDFISIANPPEDIEKILRVSCYDCHSFETNYPWTSYIAPFSWMIDDHVQEGREHLNFSIWGDYSLEKQDHKLEETIEEVEEGHMPEDSYLIMHGDAELSEEQIESFEAWFETYKASLSK